MKLRFDKIDEALEEVQELAAGSSIQNSLHLALV